MNATTTFAAVAKELADSFEERVNSLSQAYVTLKVERPEWLAGDRGTELLRSAHEALDDRLPDEWVYRSASRIADALCGYALADGDEARDKAAEIADSLVDIYNCDRAAWLASYIGNGALVDEAREDFGAGDSVYDDIARGQYLALERIAGVLIEAIEAEAGARVVED